MHGEINDLAQRYALLTDAGRRSDLEALFTDGATWDGSALGYGTAEGPAAIAELVTAHHDPARPMVHMPGPPLLESIDADEVRATSWCTATREAGPVIYFHYHDVIRRGPDGRWRYARRHLVPVFGGRDEASPAGERR